MPRITIYHNPRCGTSRNTLALLRERGIEPEVIEYLHTPPSRETLRALIAAHEGNLRAVFRALYDRAAGLPSATRRAG